LLSYPRNFLKTSLAGLFLAVIFLPVSNVFFDFIPKFDLKENRNFAPMPQFFFNSAVIKKFPHKFESFYNDHFGFRELAVRYYRWLKFKLLWISPHLDVILGNDGWLFYRGERIIEDYRGLKVYSTEELEAWKISLEKKRELLKKQGVIYLVVIAPEKSTIYPEFIPERFNKVGSSLRVQLVDYLRKHSDLDILDLRESLIGAKKKFPVYLRTDTHWNNMGAFIAYQAILTKLNHLSSGVNSNDIDLSRFKISYRTNFAGDLAYVIGAQEFSYEEYIDLSANFPLCSKKIEVDSQLVRDGIIPLAWVCPERELRLVMFRDSFATMLIPFISEHFQRSVYILNEIRDQDFLKKTIEIENPDIVIEEVAERRIGKLLVP
jgi:alginate O-acetyltransferase complex protein AlgJ